MSALPDTFPTDGPSDRPTTFPHEWINYGDVNPEPHGGAWVKWDDRAEMWHVVTNHNLRTMGPEGMIRDGEHQLVEEYWIEPHDVWIDGDPDEGFADDFRRSFSSRSRMPEHTRDMRYIAQEVALGMPHRIRGKDSYTDDLASYLSDRFGIELDD